MIGIIKGFNNHSGRFNRFIFWVHGLVMYIILSILVAIMSYLGINFGMPVLIKISSLIASLGSLYITFTLFIKRLHDLDKSGWMSLLLFIPFVNLYLLVICGFFKGTKGSNRFGDDPLALENEKGAKSENTGGNNSSIPDEL